MHTTPYIKAAPARRAAGFTLMEVLVALGLFALGFVAIAALLPAGALLQRESSDDIQSRHLERNAKATIVRTPIIETDLRDAYHPGGAGSTASWLKVFHPTATPETWEMNLANFWSLTDRSFAASVTDAQQRTFYWVPLIRDTLGNYAAPDWEIVVFVLRRDSNVTYPQKAYPAISATDPISIPGLARANASVSAIDDDIFILNPVVDGLRVNDLIVDDQGTDYRIQKIEIVSGNQEITVDSVIDTSTTTPTALWYAPPGVTDTTRAGRSPAVRVFHITGSAELDLR